MISDEEQDRYLDAKFDNYREFLNFKQETDKVIEQTASNQPNGSQPNGIAAAPVEEKVNTLAVRKGKNKRRVGLENISGPGLAEPPKAPAPMTAPPPEVGVRFEEPQTTIGFGEGSASRDQNAWARSKSMGNLPFGMNGVPSNDFRRGGFFGSPAPEDPFMGGTNDIPMVDAYTQEDSPVRPSVKPRTLGGDRVREQVAVRVLQDGGFAGGVEGAIGGVELESPPLKNAILAGVGDDILEARNAEDNSES